MKQTISLLIVFIGWVFNANAQSCDCNHGAPFTGQNACNTQFVSVFGPSSGTVSSTCDATYNIYTPNTCTGFAYVIEGGGCRCNGGGCYSQGGSTVPSSSFSLNVKWDSPGTKVIKFYGYTGNNGGYPSTLSYYGCITVNVTLPCSTPATPNDIYVSSPTGCDWLVSTNYSQGATTYEWSGNAYGTFNSVTGPAVSSGWKYLCVRAIDGACASPWYCEWVNVPQSPWCNGNQYLTSGNGASIYPNPVGSQLNLNIKEMGDYEVRITNVLGQIVVNERLQNTKEHTIDMSNIEKGLYVLVLKKGNEIIKQEKITVAR